MELGNIAREPSAPLAQVMFGALTEMGLIIAHSDNKRSARNVVGAAALRPFQSLKSARRCTVGSDGLDVLSGTNSQVCRQDAVRSAFRSVRARLL